MVAVDVGDVAALRAQIEHALVERDRAVAEQVRIAAERERIAAERNKAVADRDHYRELYLRMLEQCKKLERGILGPKSERLSQSESQLTMSILETLLAGTPAPAEPAPGSDDEATREREGADGERAPRRKPKRRPHPATLPRVELEVVPPEVELDGRAAFDQIGTDVTETLERRRASMVVVRVNRPKFVRKDRQRNAETEVFSAPAPDLPIVRGRAGPGLLAETIVQRWQDHLPLHRMESIYAREGVDIDRSTLCSWHASLAELVSPLIEAMWKDALGSPYLCTDATGVLVQAPEKCRHGHFWVVIAPERHVLYRYSARHDKAAVDEMLREYKGYLVADAHAVYDHLYLTAKIVEVACWAHARRYFWKALESEPELARQALALIKALFDIERKLANAPPGKRRSARQRDSTPLVDRFFAWCDDAAPRVLDETPIARAVTYARNQREALRRFLADERLPLHNNDSERALRREVVGRKNWLFLGSDDAGEVNATFVSLLASCQLHGIEPRDYLRDLLCLLPAWPKSRVLELAPAYWKQTLQQQDTQQRLAANVYRRAILEDPASHTPIK